MSRPRERQIGGIPAGNPAGKSRLHVMRDRLARIVFIASIAVLVIGAAFLWGYESRHHQTGLYSFVEDSRTIARSLRHFQRIVPVNLMHPAPPHASGQQFTAHRPADLPAGWYVVMGWDADRHGYAAWLLDDQGALRHTWPIDYQAIDPDGPLNGSDTPHGLLVMPDGSLILNFDHGDAMARFDACGDPLWVRPGIFHHSLDLADDGSVWTWQAEGTPYAHHHTLLRFDADTGETLEAIDLVTDVIARHHLAEIVLGTRSSFPFQHFTQTPQAPNPHDLFHPNDVEVLSAEDAPAFPQFNAGDLLISLRSNNLVAVVDRRDHRVKWWRHGPWIQQHDPDFLPDGWISIYNNNTGRGRSEILRIRPGDDRIVNPLRDGDTRFYSATMGTHQTLPEGQVLIVVPDEGRVLVTTPDGHLVAEYNNLVAGLPGVHAHVCNALWLPPAHFDTVPGCAGQ
jgi:hypothetical protein